ncbi:hypothetical protein ADL19_05585 [Streptomyces purpurogeneiscleroticus]|nr:hypothetical protein ADL19_05585 [Streptomyces purpurogeneiscleroticus]
MARIPTTDPFVAILEVTKSAIRNLGFTAKASELPPEHWQRALAVVETRMRMRRVELPDGWRGRLARRLGRGEGEAQVEPDT